MTLAQISTHLATGRALPGLTDVQNKTAFEIWLTNPREAQTYVLDILEPKVKRTLL